MSEKILFLDMFPDCASLQDSCGGLDKAEVLDVLIERESMTMLLHTWFARMPAPVERTNIEQLLAAQFRLRGVQIQAEYPAPEQKKAEQKAKVAAADAVKTAEERAAKEAENQLPEAESVVKVDSCDAEVRTNADGSTTVVYDGHAQTLPPVEGEPGKDAQVEETTAE